MCLTTSHTCYCPNPVILTHSHIESVNKDFWMSRNRKPEEDAPPSYEETIRNTSGGFCPPTDLGPSGHGPSPDLGCHPVQMPCPRCRTSVVTVTTSSPSMMAWGISTILCFTMLWPCFCLPLVMDSMLNVKHSCPNCKMVLERFRGCELGCRFGDNKIVKVS